jgi:prevent-host-death family protein
MQNVWQLQEAKNKLSQVIEEAVINGPQVITKRGLETAISVPDTRFRPI